MVMLIMIMMMVLMMSVMINIIMIMMLMMIMPVVVMMIIIMMMMMMILIIMIMMMMIMTFRISGISWVISCLCWANLGSSRAYVGDILGHLVRVLGQLEVILSLSRTSNLSRCDRGKPPFQFPNFRGRLQPVSSPKIGSMKCRTRDCYTNN